MWVVMLAVAVPLLIILVVQYKSLVELERTTPIANKAWMKKYLVTIGSRVEKVYREDAEKTLSIEPGVLDREQVPMNLSVIAAHFEQNPARSAKRLFVSFTGEAMGTEYSKVMFYDPDSEKKFRPEPGSAQWMAAHRASGGWLYHSFINMVLDTAVITVDERDPENRIITKPVLDKNRRVACVLGMLVDEKYLSEEVLPQLVTESLTEFFPNDHADVIVTLYDKHGNVSFANQTLAAEKFEAAEALPFIFKDWSLMIQMRNMTEEQGAKRVFAVNLSLSVLMTALVLGGIIMALRTASREMKLSRMKSDFVSNVSHELRTPLASIRVFGEFFKMGWVDQPRKIQEYGEYIENESRRLTQLINNILDFSKIESGGKTYQFERADLKEVVEETLKAFDVRLSQCGFSVSFKPPTEPLAPVLINRDAVTQSLMNLLDNAIKYSGASREITVQIGQKDGSVMVSVIDYGIGIPREERDKIFDKFYRVSTGLVHDVKGSGLGLSIVKHIVEAHSGKITVESTPGAGSTFTLHFPATETVGASDKPRQSKTVEGGKLPVDLGLKPGI